MTDRSGMPSARFHFDPRHDASVVPSLEQLVEWACERSRTPDTAMHVGMASVHRSRRERLTPVGKALHVIPAIERRRRAEVERISMDALRSELHPVRMTMVEFAADLRSHRLLSGSLDALASYAVMAPIEREQRDLLAKNPGFPKGMAGELERILDQIDTEARIAACHAGIRAALENEALMALLEHEDLARDPARHVSALKAAVDEMRQVDMRRRLLDMVAEIEARQP